MIEQILLFFFSTLANGLSAFAGGGAGLVQLPAILLLGLPFSVALATHKFVTVALGLGAFARLSREKTLLSLRFAAYVLVCGMFGAVAGAYLIIQVPEETARTVLGVLIIALGLYSATKKDLGQDYAPRHRDLKGYMIGGFVLFFLGLFNGSLTAGAGLFVTMFLILWFGMDYKRAVAYTMTLVGIFWNATGAAALVSMGEPIHWPWIPALLAGSFIGGYLGSHLGHLKGNLWIKWVFTIVTLLSGAALFV